MPPTEKSILPEKVTTPVLQTKTEKTIVETKEATTIIPTVSPVSPKAPGSLRPMPLSPIISESPRKIDKGKIILTTLKLNL